MTPILQKLGKKEIHLLIQVSDSLHLLLNNGLELNVLISSVLRSKMAVIDYA